MFNDGNFAEGKCEWLNLFPGRFNLAQSVQLDLWGNDEDLFVSRLYSALETFFTSARSISSFPVWSEADLFQSNYFKVHVNGFIFFIRLYACYYPLVGYTGIIACTCLCIPFTVIVYV